MLVLQGAAAFALERARPAGSEVAPALGPVTVVSGEARLGTPSIVLSCSCLLYTSDAADEL